jgi:hypothetical protein
MTPTDEQLIRHDYENEYALNGYIASQEGEVLTCPYCFSENSMTDEGYEEWTEYCGNDDCEKEFSVRRVTTVYYETIRAENDS